MVSQAAGGLVGRDGEVARLRGLVQRVVAGRGGSVWVEGEPGIGKSVLLGAGLADAAELGCRVLWASADEVGGRFPLRVMLDAMQVRPDSADPARAEIARLLVGDGLSGVVSPADVTVSVAVRLVVLLERWCAESPVVLVVDDLHWADEASVAVWGRLHRQVASLPLLLVGSCRPVPQRAELVALRRAMTEPDSMVLGLGRLAEAQVAELLGALVGAAPGPRLLRHAEQAGGNPLYLRELADALLREQLVQVQVSSAELVADAPAPPTLTAVITDRLGFLSEQTVDVLQMAALLGAGFSVADLAVITGRTPSQLTPVVHEAIAAGVLGESGPRLQFRHGLIRQALYDATPASLRSALHRQAAQALAQAGAPAGQVAQQLLAAPSAVDTWMIDWIADAAPALTYRAPQVAAELLHRVRQAVSADDPRRGRLDADAAAAAFLLGRYSDVEQLARPVLALTDDVDLTGRTAWILGYALHRDAQDELGLAMTSQTLAQKAMTPTWTARLHAMQGLILYGIGRYPEAENNATLAEQQGRQAGDSFAIGFALHVLSLAQGSQMRASSEVLNTIDRALEVVGESPESAEVRLKLLANRSVALEHLGRRGEADQTLGQALALAEQGGSPGQLAAMRARTAEAFFYRGRWDDALAELNAGIELPAEPVARVWLHGLGSLIAFHRDDRANQARHTHAVDDISLTTAALRYIAIHLSCSRALAAERDGQPEQALALLLEILDPTSTREFAKMNVDHCDMWPDVIRLALAIGDRDIAESATTAGEAVASHEKQSNADAAARHCRGLVAHDPDLIRTAADALHDYPLYRAHALEDAAVILAGHGDARAARTAYTDAIGIYTTLGATWDIRRADTRLRPHGIRRGQTGQRRRPTTGWAALTPTEITIAELVAAGRSNPDIAAHLWLSRSTVQTHVSHILTKLQAHSRVDIARHATTHHPTPARGG